MPQSAVFGVFWFSVAFVFFFFCVFVLFLLFFSFVVFSLFCCVSHVLCIIQKLFFHVFTNCQPILYHVTRFPTISEHPEKRSINLSVHLMFARLHAPLCQKFPRNASRKHILLCFFVCEICKMCKTYAHMRHVGKHVQGKHVHQWQMKNVQTCCDFLKYLNLHENDVFFNFFIHQKTKFRRQWFNLMKMDDITHVANSFLWT